MSILSNEIIDKAFDLRPVPHLLPETKITQPLDTATTLARAIMDRVERDGCLHLSSIEDEIERAKRASPMPRLLSPSEVAQRQLLGKARQVSPSVPPPGSWLDELEKLIGVHLVAKQKDGGWYATAATGSPTPGAGVMLSLLLPRLGDAISPTEWLDACEVMMGVRPGSLRRLDLA